MKELHNIIATWNQLQNQQQTAALATLVKTEGSTYRRPGARMLIRADGQHIGSISGGCLESDVIERSQTVMETGNPVLVTYDTTSEEDLIWGLGLGCQGVAHILIERLEGEELNALSVIDYCLSHRQVGAVATVFRVAGAANINVGDRLLYFGDRSVSGLDNQELEEMVTSDLRSTIQQQKSQSHSYRLSAGMVEVFLEVIEPPLSLVIFGAGFDVVPVVQVAKQLGWYVTVVDPQARSQTKERFAQCDRVVLGSVDQIESQILFDERTVGVIMTHNYLHDLELLPMLLSKALLYLGILGPKKRTHRLIGDLQEARLTPQAELEKLYTPVGLDIGADNPEEIALSIGAEICAVMRDRQGGFLKHRLAPIHAPGENSSLKEYQPLLTSNS